MRSLIILFLALGLAFGGCKPQPQQPRDDGAITPPPDDASQLMQDAAIPVQDASVQDADVPVQDASKPGASPLVEYLTTSMASWRKGDIEFYRAVAIDIVAVVTEPGEPPVFKPDPERGQTATLLATLAFFEGGLQPWVDRTFHGGCNDPTWRASREGREVMFGKDGKRIADCDGGNAISLWQVHVDETLALLPDGGWRPARGGDFADGGPQDEGVVLVRRADMESRQTAARVALHMARESVYVGAGLCNYSGEAGPCPKAKARLDFARNWWHHHPL